MNCKYCNKEAKNLNSLHQHEIRCRFNPNRIEIKVLSGKDHPKWKEKTKILKPFDLNEFCKFCGKQAKNNNSLRQHEIRCKLNPDKIEVKGMKGEKNPNFGKTGENARNQFTYAKLNNLSKPIVSIETRKKIGDASRISNKIYWSFEENRKKQSIAMKKAVNDNPDSYSLKNVSGRVKSYDFVDSFGNSTKLKGKWEVKVAEFLNEKNILWTNIISPTSYFWNNDWHLYFPDFYLKDYNLYLEVKGYERERDRCKWSHFPFELLKLKLNDIKDLNKWFSTNLILKSSNVL